MRWIAVTFVVSATAAFAQNAKHSDKEITAWNNVQQELTECVAFWQFFRACAPENASAEQLQQADQVLEHMINLSIAVESEIGMTTDAMASRLKMVADDQAKLTNGKCVNFASLATRYTARCKMLGEHPEKTLQEYLSK